MYLVQDGSHVDTVHSNLASVAEQMFIRYDYFKLGMPDCYFTPEQADIKKGFTFFAFEENEEGEIELGQQYFCTFQKITSLKGLSREVLYMSDF